MKLLHAGRARGRAGAEDARARGVARPAGAAASCSTSPRPLHSLLRDQQVIAGIGRTWVDEILHAAQALAVQARRRPLRRARPTRCARRWSASSAACSTSTRSSVELPLPEKFPKPTRVHAHQGEPCPRCETVLEAVFYEDYVMTLLPALPDRGPDPQGPPALAPAQVARAGRATGAASSSAPSRSAASSSGGEARDAGSDALMRHPVVTRRSDAQNRSEGAPRCSRQAPRPPTSRCPTRTATRSRCPTSRGQTVVLYFYPKADTPGCTTQACGIRDHLRRLRRGRRARARRLARPGQGGQEVPRQAGPELHAAGRRGPRGRASAYGVWARSRCTGETYMGAQRATFIIDADGVDRARDPEGVAEDARRRGAGLPVRARHVRRGSPAANRPPC